MPSPHTKSVFYEGAEPEVKKERDVSARGVVNRLPKKFDGVCARVVALDASLSKFYVDSTSGILNRDAVSQHEPQRDAPRVAGRLHDDSLCYRPQALGAEPQRTRAEPAPDSEPNPRNCPRRA